MAATSTHGAKPPAGGPRPLNFLGAHTPPDVVERAFAPDVLRRLRRVKHEIDPDNVFRIHHRIAPAASDGAR